MVTESNHVAFCGLSGSVPTRSNSANQYASQIPGFKVVSTTGISLGRFCGRTGNCDQQEREKTGEANQIIAVKDK